MSLPPMGDPDSNDAVDAREQETLDAIAEIEDPDSPLTVQVLERAGFPVIRPEGELDLYTVEIFRDQLRKVLDAHPPGLVVDLSRTGYIDSSGLGLLLRAARTLPGAVAVVTARERVLRLFQATGLTEILSVHRTLPEAVDALKAKAG